MGKSQSVCHYKLIENLIMTVLDFIVCVCVCVYVHVSYVGYVQNQYKIGSKMEHWG